MSNDTLARKPEADPTGRDPHVPGAKLDAGKVRPALVLGGFARALLEVSRVGTYGAAKYTENGWVEVPDGENRYDDAGMRHWLEEKCGVECDPDTQLKHAAHEAWNALARLDLMLRDREKVQPIGKPASRKLTGDLYEKVLEPRSAQPGPTVRSSGQQIPPTPWPYTRPERNTW